jgi:hypothetical protein
MKHLWNALPASMQGQWAADAAELAPAVVAAVKAHDVVLVKGSRGEQVAIKGIPAPLWRRLSTRLNRRTRMLHNLLYPLADHFQLFNLFKYITFRTGGAMLTALLICWLSGPSLIRWLKTKQAEGQPIPLLS